MKKNTIFEVLFLVITCIPSLTLAIEPISVGIVFVAGGGAIAGKWAYCQFNECCTPKWTNHSSHTMTDSFRDNLIGQHLVTHIVAKSIRKHLQQENPKKALVLSFHGWTGSGKNFVADIIAKHVYKKGVQSKFITKYIAGNDFPHKDELKQYKDRIKREIVEKTKACEHSMFIFDEIEKMPAGLIDILKAFIDFHQDVNGVDFRKNIFIFIGNTGGDEINKEVFKHFRSGESRQDITAKQMEFLLSIDAFNNNGGLKDANILLAGLVDFFVPFLPMEREHVKQCVRAELIRRNHALNEKIVNEVAKEMDYFPKKNPMFSTTGCKKVSKKMDLILD